MRSFFEALSTSGPASAAISWLSQINLGLGTAIWLVVLLIITVAIARRRSAEGPGSGSTVTIVTATVFTIVILFGLAYASYATDRRVEGHAGTQLSVHIDGKQFWWLITYNDSNPSRRLTTANELVIPAGKTVEISLTSHDVIHSLWAPALQGKVDLVPGYTNLMMLRVDSVGVYQGRCAEFCGDQHAKMKFLVVVVPPDSFSSWYENQLADAAVPIDSMTLRGQAVLATGSCGLCHNVRGTPASGTVGPDLTHLASRQTIAAGALPNNRGNLAGWILDPQRIKPGNHMPPNRLTAADLQSLLSYLESLR